MEKTFIKKEDISAATDDPVPVLGTVKAPNLILNRKLPGIISLKTLDFINTFFPQTTYSEWNDWRWQLKNSVTNLENLKKILDLNDEELFAFDNEIANLPFRITPYFASRVWNTNTNFALRKTVIPQIFEFMSSNGEDPDPLKEDEDSPVQGIVHRYPDRVLFMVTSFCSTYCRYCTRSRLVGDDKHSFNPGFWDDALKYIENNSSIRDVLLSGGDPLTMSDQRIEYLLSRLRKIPHVEIIRIGTKVPVVLPQRITQSLLRVLKKFHPVYLSIHFIHPDEITEETKFACEMLADAGIPLGSQTVLLKDINDDVATMKELMHQLLKIRVKPYYLYQCDPIPGSAHFRTSIEKGLEIIKGLRGFTSGYAVPHYVIDAPGGGGKIPLLPEYYVRRDENYVYLKSYDGEIYKYPDPV